MKKMFCIAFALVLMQLNTSVLFSQDKKAAEKDKAVLSKADKQAVKGTFAIYRDQGSPENHFIPSGWMGDYGDLKLKVGSNVKPKAGKSCVQIIYNGLMAQGAGWAGIYWQYPANNWGSKDKAIDLTGMKRLTFWARGEKGGEIIAEFKVGGIQGEFPDSDSESIGPITLSKEWEQYTIDLSKKDLSHIIGGFCWSASRDENPNGMTFYLDDIIFEE